MYRLLVWVAAVSFVLPLCSSRVRTADASKSGLRVGVAAIPITPFGKNPDWDGTTTESGVWGEHFTDTNHNGRWDKGEPFEDDQIGRAHV